MYLLSCRIYWIQSLYSTKDYNFQNFLAYVHVIPCTPCLSLFTTFGYFQAKLWQLCLNAVRSFFGTLAITLTLHNKCSCLFVHSDLMCSIFPNLWWFFTFCLIVVPQSERLNEFGMFCLILRRSFPSLVSLLSLIKTKFSIQIFSVSLVAFMWLLFMSFLKKFDIHEYCHFYYFVWLMYSCYLNYQHNDKKINVLNFAIFSLIFSSFVIPHV